jgi:hypothetical protein
MFIGLGRGPPPPGRGGMPPGLGRGPPAPGAPGRPEAGRGGAPAARSPRGALGRSLRGPAGRSLRCAGPGRGPGLADPIPVLVEENGLLPGRGRPPGRWPGAAGRGEPPGPPVRGPGFGPGPCPCPCPGPGRPAAGLGRGPGLGPSDGAAGPVGLAGAAGPDGPAAGRGAAGRGACWRGAGCGAGLLGTSGTGGRSGRGGAGGASALISGRASALGSGWNSGLGAAGFGAAGLRGPGLGAEPFRPSADLAAGPPKASLSLRTTGASIVDDADRTNSPISLSLAMTALLSTPNSLASSYTRTFATALPTRSGDVLGPSLPCGNHRCVLIERS